MDSSELMRFYCAIGLAESFDAGAVLCPRLSRDRMEFKHAGAEACAWSGVEAVFDKDYARFRAKTTQTIKGIIDGILDRGFPASCFHDDSEASNYQFAQQYLDSQDQNGGNEFWNALRDLHVRLYPVAQQIPHELQTARNVAAFDLTEEGLHLMNLGVMVEKQVPLSRMRVLYTTDDLAANHLLKGSKVEVKPFSELFQKFKNDRISA